MSALELVILIGIIAVFSTFGAILAWVSWADGKPASAPRAIPARAAVRNGSVNRVDQIGRATSA
jgi:hypothetical protein